MMKALFISFLLLMAWPAVSQNDHRSVIDSLDKIIIQNDITNPFASIYREMAVKLDQYANMQDDHTKAFLRVFDQQFASLFFKSRDQNLNNHDLLHWQTFYRNKDLNDLQRMALGMNAHINGDLWMALTKAHPYDSIQKYSKAVLNFQYAFNSLFDSLYTNNKLSSRARFLHTISLGMDKKLMKRAVYRWRKKQVKLALMYYKNERSMDRSLKRLQRKMKGFDHFVLKWMK